jgi:hypothetical protein
MVPHPRSWFTWTARLAGLAVSLFLALFALDAFDERTFWQALPAFALHLVPAAVVGALAAAAWRHPWVGAAGFATLAIAYAWISPRLDWIVVISGPLALVAVLFALSALTERVGSRPDGAEAQL